MRAISSALRERLLTNTTMLVKATLTLADGTEKELTGDDLVSLSTEQSTSRSGSFDIGAAIIGRAIVELNNHDERFSGYDFTGASIVPYAGVALPDGATEWLRLGTYYVDQPDSYAGTIQLTALDALSKLEVPYSSVTSTSYPASLYTIADDICTACGLILGSQEFANGGYVVARRPDSDSLSCLTVMGYVAQASGNYVKADEHGHVLVDWYDTTVFESESSLDGGTLSTTSTPYSDGAAADGGTFDYGESTSYDGGTFGTSSGITHIWAVSSLTVNTDDVVVTGVSVTASNEVVTNADGRETNGRDGETALNGKQGYVLSCDNNPLVLYGQAAEVASQVAARVVGMRFRPFSCSSVTNPEIEAGDPVVVSDARGNNYNAYVTSVTFRANGAMSVSCDAKSAGRNSAGSSSAATSAYVRARNDLKREKTAREIAEEDLQKRVSETGGLYQTIETLSDGSRIYYMHDKPTVAASKIVWKMNSGAIAVSTDSGKTYTTGLTAEGEALMTRIYAHGLDADYITTGRISSTDGSSYIDLDSGDFVLGMGSVTGLGSALDAKSGTYVQDTAPTSGMRKGDLWTDTSTQSTYTWDGTQWVKVGGGADGQDAISIDILSTAGTVFKTDTGSTTLKAIVRFGATRCETSAELVAALGAGAHVAWSYKRAEDSEWQAVPASDSRLGDNGMTWTITAQDVSGTLAVQADVEL